MGEVVPRGWRDGAFRPEEVSESGNSDREVLAAHDAETTNSHKAQKKLGKQVNRARYDRYVTSLDGLPTHARSPEEIGPFGESETQRMRKGQVTESVRTRSCRVVTSEAGGRSTRHTSPGVPLYTGRCHTSPGVPVRRVATSGDRGALGGDVSRLWGSGCQHPTCALVPPCKRSGKPTPVVGPRDLPLPEPDVRPPPSGNRCAL